MTGAIRIVHRNALVYRRTWRGTVLSSFLQPTLFLLVIGVTLGRFVDRGGASLPGNVSFLAFLAPGMLAAACMQMATFESAFSVTAKMTWNRNYEAIAATPMTILEVVIGELAWITLRLFMVALAFTVVMVTMGVPHSPLVWLAIPAAVLNGLAFAAPIMAYAATVKSGSTFNWLFRFVITPLFLFSGVFFPITRLPEALQKLAWCTPLFHGAALARDLALGTARPGVSLIHVAYLVGVVVIGVIAATWTFERKLRA